MIRSVVFMLFSHHVTSANLRILVGDEMVECEQRVKHKAEDTPIWGAIVC